MSETKILEVLEEVEFRYPQDTHCSYSIPAGLSLSVGEAWCIRGISGSGKSTLMTLLAALRRFNRGTVRYCLDGAPVDVTPGGWDTVVGPGLWRRIGFAFQRPELIRALSVTDNLRLALGNDAPARPALFQNEEDEWEKIAASAVWKISGGQVQRLGLLRAFGLGQNLVFLDEPTNNLDRRNRQDVAEFVQSHRNTHALVVVSHDEDFIATLGIDRMLGVTELKTTNGDIRRCLFPARTTPAPESSGADDRELPEPVEATHAP